MSKYIIGLDIGNADVKTDKGIVFSNKIKVGTQELNKKDIKVVFNNLKYTVGKGNSNIGINKYKNTNFKISVLTAIAKNFNNEQKINCNIVLGTPVEIFNKQKDIIEDIKKTIKNWGTQNIIVDGILKNITIKDIEIFCESGIPFSDKDRFEKEKTLVVDLGGGTLDISLWNGLELVDCKSNDKMGMINLYQDIIAEVNNTYSCNLNYNDAKEIIGKDNYKINGKDKDVSFVNAIIENFVIGLTSDINQIFPFANCDSVQLIGGGAVALKNYFLDKNLNLISNAEINDNAVFLNAKTFKKVGEIIWS